MTVTASGLDQLRTQANRAALDSLHSLATFWLKIDSPTLATGDGQNWRDSLPVDFLHDKVLAVSGAVFTLAILIAGIRMAWEQRARPLQELLKATMLFVMVCGAGTATLQLLASWSDDFAIKVMSDVSGGDVQGALSGLITQGSTADDLTKDWPIFLALGISLAVLTASLIQVVLLLIRSAMLVLLAGTFPVAAAATNTEPGRAWFKKYCAWSLAFIAYKPAAALVYAAAIKMTEQGMLSSDNVLVQALTGIMMLMLAIFALPALLRFAVPVTSAVAGGSAGMGSSVADPGGLATGAVNVGRSAFGGSGGSGGGSGGGSSSGGGGGASGARSVGAAAGGAAGGAAGIGLAAARKAAGSLAGAASHSAGESGGGSITPSTASGPMARGGRSRPARSSSSAAQERIPEPAGPSGSR
ncbi:type IV secretion system protein [Kribbella sp. NPDC051952]|uniref:type IV secretion system protein n=1 Tax=Kribbella sp. NPDC051952 TaxID=3154851 RepID=UPI003444CAF8